MIKNKIVCIKFIFKNIKNMFKIFYIFNRFLFYKTLKINLKKYIIKKNNSKIVTK